MPTCRPHHRTRDFRVNYRPSTKHPWCWGRQLLIPMFSFIPEFPLYLNFLQQKEHFRNGKSLEPKLEVSFLVLWFLKPLAQLINNDMRLTVCLRYSLNGVDVEWHAEENSENRMQDAVCLIVGRPQYCKAGVEADKIYLACLEVLLMLRTNTMLIFTGRSNLSDWSFRNLLTKRHFSSEWSAQCASCFSD